MQLSRNLTHPLPLRPKMPITLHDKQMAVSGIHYDDYCVILAVIRISIFVHYEPSNSLQMTKPSMKFTES